MKVLVRPKQRLTLATVPICPTSVHGCGAECTLDGTESEGVVIYKCNDCGERWKHPDWGYYERNDEGISGVVEDLKRWLKEGQHIMHAVYVVAKEARVLGWIKELEPTGGANRH